MSTTLAIWGVRWRFSDGRPRFEAVPALILTLRAESQGEEQMPLAAVAEVGVSSRRLRCEMYLPTGNHLSYRGITALSSCRARRARMCSSAGLSSVMPLSPMAQEGSNELRL